MITERLHSVTILQLLNDINLYMQGFKVYFTRCGCDRLSLLTIEELHEAFDTTVQ